MKRNLLLSLLCFMSVSVFAQFSFDHVEVTTDALISSDDVPSHARLYNETSNEQNYIWTREEVVMASGWTSAVCDTNQCYLTFVNTQDFKLNGDESADLIVHLYPDGVAGEGEIKVTVEQESDPMQMHSVTYYFTVTEPTNIESPENFSVSIYPNPTNDYIMLSENNVVREITIYNILGRSIRTFKAQDGLRYDISDLSSGMYLAKLTDAKGKTLKTLRVSKR